MFHMAQLHKHAPWLRCLKKCLFMHLNCLNLINLTFQAFCSCIKFRMEYGKQTKSPFTPSETHSLVKQTGSRWTCKTSLSLSVCAYFPGAYLPSKNGVESGMSSARGEEMKCVAVLGLLLCLWCRYQCCMAVRAHYTWRNSANRLDEKVFFGHKEYGHWLISEEGGGDGSGCPYGHGSIPKW